MSDRLWLRRRRAKRRDLARRARLSATGGWAMPNDKTVGEITVKIAAGDFTKKIEAMIASMREALDQQMLSAVHASSALQGFAEAGAKAEKQAIQAKEHVVPLTLPKPFEIHYGHATIDYSKVEVVEEQQFENDLSALEQAGAAKTFVQAPKKLTGGQGPISGEFSGVWDDKPALAPPEWARARRIAKWMQIPIGEVLQRTERDLRFLEHAIDEVERREKRPDPAPDPVEPAGDRLITLDDDD